MTRRSGLHVTPARVHTPHGSYNFIETWTPIDAFQSVVRDVSYATIDAFARPTGIANRALSRAETYTIRIVRRNESTELIFTSRSRFRAASLSSRLLLISPRRLLWHDFFRKEGESFFSTEGKKERFSGVRLQEHVVQTWRVTSIRVTYALPDERQISNIVLHRTERGLETKRFEPPPRRRTRSEREEDREKYVTSTERGTLRKTNPASLLFVPSFNNRLMSLVIKYITG